MTKGPEGPFVGIKITAALGGQQMGMEFELHPQQPSDSQPQTATEQS